MAKVEFFKMFFAIKSIKQWNLFKELLKKFFWGLVVNKTPIVFYVCVSGIYRSIGVNLPHSPEKPLPSG